MKKEPHEPAAQRNKKDDRVKTYHLERHDLWQIFSAVCHADDRIKAAWRGGKNGAYHIEIGHMLDEESGPQSRKEEDAGTQEHDGDLALHLGKCFHRYHGSHADPHGYLGRIEKEGRHFYRDMPQKFRKHAAYHGSQHTAARDMKNFEQNAAQRTAYDKHKHRMVHRVTSYSYV